MGNHLNIWFKHLYHLSNAVVDIFPGGLRVKDNFALDATQVIRQKGFLKMEVVSRRHPLS